MTPMSVPSLLVGISDFIENARNLRKKSGYQVVRTETILCLKNYEGSFASVTTIYTHINTFSNIAHIERSLIYETAFTLIIKAVFSSSFRFVFGARILYAIKVIGRQTDKASRKKRSRIPSRTAVLLAVHFFFPKQLFASIM